MALNDPKVIQWVVESPRTLAVVGLSDKPDRPSHHVAEEMQQRGYKIVPVTPKGETILGEKVYRSLAEIPFPVDVVDVFRAPPYVMEVVRDMAQMASKPKVLWLQEGVINAEAVAAAEAMGIDVVQDRCVYKEIVRAGK
ncbi:MAG: CoA-binding protein [Bacillota bacterium]